MTIRNPRLERRFLSGAIALALLAFAAPLPAAAAVSQGRSMLHLVSDIDTDSIKAFCEGRRQKLDSPLPVVCPAFNRPIMAPPSL